MGKRTAEVSANQILTRVQNKLYPEPAHVMLCEVRNATGAYASRSADGLVVSCWPSRGLWLAGIEVKVSRGDWRSELKDPNKSMAVQQYCDYWWLVTTPNVVGDGELPEAWGLIVVDGNDVKIVRPAPKLEPKPTELSFLTSVLRNVAQQQNRVRNLIRQEMKVELEALIPDADTKLKLERQIEDQKFEILKLKQDFEALKTEVRNFENASGLSVTNTWSERNWGALAKATMELRHRDLDITANSLDHIAKLLREAAQSLK